MPANDHLSPLLDAYTALTDPGFAVAVTAPWGVGKTHAVQQWIGRRPHLYVSLFGVDSVAAAQEAVFIAALQQTDATQARLRAKSADALSKIAGGAIAKATGVSVDLSGAYRNLVLKHAPRLMIFDDLERALLAPPLLLGLINRFVEHEGRNVILIANEAELDKSEDYRRWREKVVGRNITLAPDTEAALQVFLAQVPEAARAFMTAHRDLLRQVFDLSETHNLRLLRQAMLEWARFHAALPPDITGNAEGMRHLLADFIALTVAYHGALIDKEDLGQEIGWERGAWQVGGCQDPEPPENGVERLLKRYVDFPTTSLNGSVLPGDLAKRVIGDGHAPPEDIATALRALALFRDPDAEPWITLWRWRRRPEARVVLALEKVQAQISARQFTQPEEILHVFGSQLDLSGHGLIAWSLEEVVGQALSYIADVEAAGRLPSDVPAYRWRVGPDQQSAFGLGYMARETDEFGVIRSALIAALERQCRQANPMRVRQLLDLLEDSPYEFQAVIAGEGKPEGLLRYFDASIYLDVDAKDVATRVFSWPPERWLDFLRPFSRSDLAHSVTFRDGEDAPVSLHDWLLAFHAHALTLADTSGPVRRTQIRQAMDGFVKFLDPPPIDAPA